MGQSIWTPPLPFGARAATGEFAKKSEPISVVSTYTIQMSVSEEGSAMRDGTSSETQVYTPSSHANFHSNYCYEK